MPGHNHYYPPAPTGAEADLDSAWSIVVTYVPYICTIAMLGLALYMLSNYLYNRVINKARLDLFAPVDKEGEKQLAKGIENATQLYKKAQAKKLRSAAVAPPSESN